MQIKPSITPRCNVVHPLTPSPALLQNSVERCKTPSALTLRTTSKSSAVSGDEQATPDQLQEPRPQWLLDSTDEEAETIVDEADSPDTPHSSTSTCSVALSEMS